MKHVMLDLETLGVAPGCVVLAIGAVAFDLDGKTGEHFYRTISAESCRQHGLVEDPRTVEWWSQQPKEVRDALMVDRRLVRDVAKEFHQWFLVAGAEFVWCQGASFDVPIWEGVCRILKGPIPWKFWNVRDTRTVYDLFGFDPRDLLRAGKHHNALDDARFQVECVAAALRRGRQAAVQTTDAFA